MLGGGSGGYAAGLRAGTRGLSVALVERDKVGGTCLHRGCIPTKALLHSAEVFDTIGEAGAVGVRAGNPTYDLPRVPTSKAKEVTTKFQSLQGLIQNLKIEVSGGL